jgi:hypothetical protein
VESTTRQLEAVEAELHEARARVTELEARRRLLEAVELEGPGGR